MDVRAPGIGELTPDGKSLYFSWTITGIGQIWRVDGPRRFPQQITAGEDSTSLAVVTPDGNWLVVQRDRKGEEDPGLYLQPVGGGPVEVVQHVRGVRTTYEGISSDSRSLYFAANDRKPDAYVVYRWDIGKKEKQAVFDEPQGLWHVADVADDGRLLLRKETGSLTAEVWEWAPPRRRSRRCSGKTRRKSSRCSTALAAASLSSSPTNSVTSAASTRTGRQSSSPSGRT